MIETPPSFGSQACAFIQSRGVFGNLLCARQCQSHRRWRDAKRSDAPHCPGVYLPSPASRRRVRMEGAMCSQPVTHTGRLKQQALVSLRSEGQKSKIGVRHRWGPVTALSLTRSHDGEKQAPSCLFLRGHRSHSGGLPPHGLSTSQRPSHWGLGPQDMN